MGTPPIPPNTPTAARVTPIGTEMHIAGRPAIAPSTVAVPVVTNGNPLSALEANPGPIAVNRLDLATQANPRMAPQLGVRAPSGTPVRPVSSHIAPSGIQNQNRGDQ
jgi:hypothetical protein